MNGCMMGQSSPEILGVDRGECFAFLAIGAIYGEMNEMEKSILNYRKAAHCGVSMEYVSVILRRGYMDGYMNKEEYELTLRKQHAACCEMKSKAREIMRMKGSGTEVQTGPKKR